MIFGKTKGKYFSREGWTSGKDRNRKSRSDLSDGQQLFSPKQAARLVDMVVKG
jgi:hypothetical protein